MTASQVKALRAVVRVLKRPAGLQLWWWMGGSVGFYATHPWEAVYEAYRLVHRRSGWRQSGGWDVFYDGCGDVCSVVGRTESGECALITAAISRWCGLEVGDMIAWRNTCEAGDGKKARAVAWLNKFIASNRPKRPRRR